MSERRSFRDRAGMTLERWVRRLACLGWSPPPPEPDVSSPDTAPPDLNQQLQDLFREVRHQELIWKSDEWLKRTSRLGFRRPRPKGGNQS